MVAPNVAHAQSNTDYDSDNDGLIEVANLAQLNAIRWDLDGNGAAATGGDTTNYTAAFPNAVSGMGCPTSGSPTGCEGYELTADLGFDDIHSGTGIAWLSIGTSSGPFNAKFDGGGHVVSNLFLGFSGADSGLFAAIGADGEVSNLGLTGVDIYGGSAYAGALAGLNAGTITASFVDDRASWSRVREGIVATGGLVGKNSGTITGSYAIVAVRSDSGQVGGLVGVNSGTITDSYTDGRATAWFGGNAGGLVGRLDSSGSITNSYSISYVGGEVVGGSALGGLVGAKSASSTVTASYFSGFQGTSAGGTYKLDVELQAPTSNTGIYADWSTSRWDFGDFNNFPLLKADWDGDGTATWGEFGGQDPEPEFADDAAIADMFLRVDTGFTSPPLPSIANNHRFPGWASSISPSLPDGLQRIWNQLEQAYKVSGTPTAVLARTQFTWNIADYDDGVASLSFYLTVLPEGDYDADDDGLIEVGSLAEFNAMRWDLDGDGTSTNSGYATAFPNPETGMGCNEDETDAADQVCEGYELIADLDFDTNGDGTTDVAGSGCTPTGGVYSGTCDDYWNHGAGWLPIGTSSSAFDAKFDGGGHVVSNLFIDRSSGDNGLFGAIGTDGEVSYLGLTEVRIEDGGANAGALAGQNAGTVTASFVEPRELASFVESGSVATGGLVGDNSGSIIGSYATVSVKSSSGQIGGLVGVNSGAITDSYADRSASSNGGGNAGGLVGRLDSSGSITDSYSGSAVGGEPASGSTLGGLVGAKSASSTVTASYWATDTSKQTTSPGGGTGKTRLELGEPISNTGIYADWSTTRWAFEAYYHTRPFLKADWDGDGTATWGEFGHQDPHTEYEFYNIADMVLTVGTPFTSPALPGIVNGYRFHETFAFTRPSLPDGLELIWDSDAEAYKVSGTPTEALAGRSFGFVIADLDGGGGPGFNLFVLPSGDYDGDDDGLIEVGSLAQLDAVRWDLDGDGSAASGSDSTNYAAAFLNADVGMGCNEDEEDAADQVCEGYELVADLDFDTNGDGTARVAGRSCYEDNGVYVGFCDDYWNDGKGWLPIGASTSAFDAKFDGGGHVVSNLFIDRSTGDNGLFGAIGADAEVSNLGLVVVKIDDGGANVGALAGQNAGTITASFVDGRAFVSWVTNSIIATGGLVGVNSGTITGSYAIVVVRSDSGQVGGLVGVNSGTIADSYTDGNAQSHGGGNAGGLVGRLDSSGSITDSYSWSSLVGEPATGSTLGGLVGAKSASATVTTSYWATGASGQTASAGGTGKTINELQAPTSNTGIYADWATARWDFVDANHLPLLKADWDGDGTATWGEFGDQDPEPEFADDAAIAEMVLTVGTPFTSPALPNLANEDRFFHRGGDLVTPSLPAGLQAAWDQDARAYKISGTPTVPLARTQFTYTFADLDDGLDSLTFYLTVVSAGDYDFDDDGLIEVADLAQLDAVRWDLDGDGTASSGDETTYAAAFPDAEAGMGCNEDAATDSDKVCIGYELLGDLDFDTNGDGVTNVAGDAYWNSGKGWTPIGVFAAVFEGNGNTIANLFINGPSTNAGLFDGLGTGGEVRNLGLAGASVTASGKVAGGIAGTLVGDAEIKTSYVTGAVKGKKAGGVAGAISGSAQILKSYAAGSVTATGSGSRAGGLVGDIAGPAKVLNSYATASVSASGASASAGGLASFFTGTGAQVKYSYAIGAVSSTGSNRTVGGLLAAKDGNSTFTDSYWDTSTTGQSASPGGGTAKNTAQLQAPTAAGGIYTSWAAADWDFGTANHYPALKADWDGDGTATAAEFGDQLIDYDADDDGLIEAGSLAQLNAIRWDPDGDGAASTGNEAGYAAAFPVFQAGMGCNEDETAANDQVCAGYELTADLDFDTDGDGTADSGDAYWNSGAGWTPINGLATDFEGNGHAISNLFINATSGVNGLFATIAAAGEVRNLGLVDVDVTNASTASNDRAGALAGALSGDVSSVYVSGGTVAHTGASNAGGLIGNILAGGSVTSSWSSAAVSAAAANTSAGGLAAGLGVIGQAATIADSYATGAVTHTGSGGRTGGLVGVFFAGTIDDSYATGAVSGATSGGLVGFVFTGATVTTSYYDTTTTGQTGDPGKTTSELQAPTSNTGIYSAWSADKWDFGTASLYPALKADFNGDGTATAGEFGDQGRLIAFAADATIADQELTQGEAYTSAAALPAPTVGTAPYTYQVTPALPAGLSLNSDRKITGTPAGPTAKTGYTYTATDTTGESASLTFTLSAKPKKPAGFTAAAANTEVTLAWTAIAGVSGWQFKQDSGSWTAITGSGAATNSHTVTGLTNGTEYTFKVRALVGDSNAAPSTQVIGVESDAESATPADDLAPTLAAVADKTYLQGSAVDFTLPAATGGDGHPDYTYTLTPDVSGSGLTFTASTRKLTGTPSTPVAKITYTYTATETSDSDGATESADRTFTIGIQPKKPANFTATAGNTEVTLAWTALAGVTKWQVQQDTGSWTDISGSGAATSSHAVTNLTNGTEYTFKVRALVGSGATLVTGVESDAKSATPADDLVPALADITDKTYVQGATVDETLPAATGGDSPGSYAYTLTPDVSGSGLTFTASTRTLSGTPSTPVAKVTYTYTATETTDSDGATESADRTFTIGIQPQKPANFTAAVAGDTGILLTWTAIAGVSGWQVKQDSGAWTAIASSGAATTSHTVTGLAGETSYTFRVRAVVGSGATLVTGVESDAASATTPADLAPSLAGVSDMIYRQGAAVNFTLPAATGGDGHPSYAYTLSPDVSGIGLAFTASTRTLSGTPSTPRAKTTYTYTATESNDPDGTTESAGRTFTIGIQPKKPANLSVTSDGAWATLTWTAIPGVSGWQVQQNNGNWTGIAGSGATTSRAVVNVGGAASTTFKVRAFVGSGDSRVDGVESDSTRATQVIDYDHDNDGLIDISTLAQLQASRLDTNGDGRTDDRSMQPLYDRAFPGAAPGMGCPFSGCRGYELTTDDLTPRPRG